MKATIINGRPAILVLGFTEDGEEETIEHMLDLKAAKKLANELWDVVRRIHITKFREIRTRHMAAKEER